MSLRKQVFLNDDDDDEVVLDKGETLLKKGIPPMSTLQGEDGPLGKIIKGVNQKV